MTHIKCKQCIFGYEAGIMRLQTGMRQGNAISNKLSF